MNPYLSFSQALVQLKAGKNVAREGWNGKHMFLFYVCGGICTHPALGGKAVDSLPYIAMYTAQGNVVPWLASQTDLLSDDWSVVE